MGSEMISRINLEEFLLSESERVSLEPSIYKGFSFLVDVLVEFLLSHTPRVLNLVMVGHKLVEMMVIG